MRYAVLALLALAACSAKQERTESTDSATSAAAEQDWTGFPNGQCLTAVQAFYPYRFGVSVPVARNSWSGSCAYEGACHIWIDDIPDGNVWERIANDGSEEPSPYDLIVFPETSQNPWGHIASVDHVSGGEVYVMDSNYNSDERRASLPHTVWRPAYGWYHLRSLPKSGPSQPQGEWCPNNGGHYCGGDGVGGDSSTLYDCVNHSLEPIQNCGNGCKYNPPGVQDVCNSAPQSLGWCPNNGLYCGGDYVSGDPSTLYRCTSHVLTVEQWCASGCKVNVDGIDDGCW
jgi:hypothetical protein